MWQRKQTVFLICSLVAIIICLLSPIGAVDPRTLGTADLLTNIGWTGGRTESLPAFPFFILAAIAGIISVVDVFQYHNRKLQMRLCTWAMFADFLWCVYYVVFFFGINSQLHVRFAACLPIVSGIFLWLAKKGIKADDDLVKSMDRIR